MTIAAILVPDSVQLSEDSSLENDRNAEMALDGNLLTYALSAQKLDTDLYYLIKFADIKCIEGIKIFQAKLTEDALRMNGTTIAITNSITGFEHICGELITTNDYSVVGQTYFFPCNFNGGDQIKLLVNHETSQYTKEGMWYQL